MLLKPTNNRTADFQSLALQLAVLILLYFAAIGHATAEGDGNPCGLLSTAEVEAVLGEPVAGPPFRADGTQASTSGASCRYEAASFRAVTITVDWSNGGEAFGLMKMTSSLADAVPGVLTLTDGTTLRGAWDDAALFLCCEFNALRGDRRVMIDIGASTATVAQAASLADLAIQRLDQPLPVDSEAGIADALARAEGRPVITSACDLITRAEAENLVGANLVTDPQGGESGCSYAWQPAGADYQEEIRLLVTWRDGFGELRRIKAAIGMGMDMLADEGLNLAQDATQETQLFDEYSVSIIGVMAVRKDVLLSIESGPMSDMAAKFIAVAASKL